MAISRAIEIRRRGAIARHDSRPQSWNLMPTIPPVGWAVWDIYLLQCPDHPDRHYVYVVLPLTELHRVVVLGQAVVHHPKWSRRHLYGVYGQLATQSRHRIIAIVTVRTARVHLMPVIYSELRARVDRAAGEQTLPGARQ